jgi:hypothetical protein
MVEFCLQREQVLPFFHSLFTPRWCCLGLSQRIIPSCCQPLCRLQFANQLSLLVQESIEFFLCIMEVCRKILIGPTTYNDNRNSPACISVACDVVGCPAGQVRSIWGISISPSHLQPWIRKSKALRGERRNRTAREIFTPILLHLQSL